MGVLWGRRLREAESLHIAIANAVQGKLAVTDGLEQLAVIRREGLERSHTSTMAVRGLAKLVQDFLQRGVLVDAGQGIQVAFGGFSGHLGAAVQSAIPRRRGRQARSPCGSPSLGR